MTIKTIVKHLVLFVTGAFLYGAIEIIASGNTHWTMLILGGVCFLLVGFINEFLPKEMSITTQMILGMIIITFLEFLTGCIVNIWLCWDVWDYSQEPYNVLGQICVKNSFYWFLLSGAAIVLDDCLRTWMFKEEKPKYYL